LQSQGEQSGYLASTKAPDQLKSTNPRATFKFFSEANAVLSGFFHGLDFSSTFDQAKVERKIKKFNGAEFQIPPSEGRQNVNRILSC